ncbi:unnamed protein product, partial [Allacma fusca]
GSIFDQRPTVYEGSEQSLRSELNLFTLPPTDVSTKNSSEYVPSFPLTSVREGFAPLEFLLLAENSGYYDLSDSFLSLTCRIVKQNGEECGDTNIVAPSSNFFHAMFQNLEVYVNITLVSDSSNFYPSIAYIQRLLSANPIEKANALRDELWYPNDVPEKFTSADQGFKKRFELSQKSQQFTMLGKLCCNIFNQPRWFPSGTEIRIILKRSPPEFCLNSAVETLEPFSGCPYRVELNSAIFYSSRKTISQKILDMHRQKLASGDTCKYPMVDVDMRTFTVAKGLTSATNDGIVLGRIPKIIVIGVT